MYENDFGKEAIDTIVPFMENHRNDFVLIVAGYTEDMNNFLNANTGLKSRFNHTIHFEDYSADEMVKIFEIFVKNTGYSLEQGVENTLKIIFNMMKKKSEHFGNGRDARKIFDEICQNMDKRLAKDESIMGDALNVIKQIDLIDVKI